MTTITKYIKTKSEIGTDGRTKYTLDGYFDTVDDKGNPILAKLRTLTNIHTDDLTMEKVQKNRDIKRAQDEIADIDLKIAAIELP